MKTDYLFTERYRPDKIDDCILPKKTKDFFNSLIKDGEILNLILEGDAGSGKTTAAIAMCKEMGVDYILINGSKDGNIDKLRNDVTDFASTCSFDNDKPKVVIFDEADYLNPQSTQPALRGFIEEFHSNCRFIFTCNYVDRILEPIRSRCSIVKFEIPKDEKKDLMVQFIKRVAAILKENDIEFETAVVAQLVKNHFPDFRQTLVTIQKYSKSGPIDTGILSLEENKDIKDLINYMVDKDFGKIRAWVDENDVNPRHFVRTLYDNTESLIVPDSIPQLILHLRDYMRDEAVVMDSKINLLAWITEIIADVEFK